MLKDTACANGINTDLEHNDCFFNGPKWVSAMAWECAGADESFAATATSTVEAGAVLTVAMSDAGAAALTTASAHSAATKGESAATMATATQAAPTLPATGNPSQTGTSADNTSDTGSGGSSGSGGASSGLSKTDQIALDVAIPAGAIIIAVIAWLWPKSSK